MLSFIFSNLLIIPNILTAGISPVAMVEPNRVPEQMQSITVSYDIEKQTVAKTDIVSSIYAGNGKYYDLLPVTNQIVKTALSLRGIPYVFGGESLDGFDCSGFTAYVYGLNGITLPHSAGDQAAMGTIISESEAVPGDLLYWPGHVAIWLSGGVMIDSAEPGTTVSIRAIWGSPQFIRINK